jgi:hypothetical protein
MENNTTSFFKPSEVRKRLAPNFTDEELLEKFPDRNSSLLEEYVNYIQDGIESVYETLDKNLSLMHIGFDIDYKDRKYKFTPPTTKEEQKQHEREKKKFIKLLLSDCLKDSLNSVIKKKLSTKWHMILSFDEQYLTKWEQQEPITADQVYALVEDPDAPRERAVDLSSQYVHAQRPDMTPEKFQEFIAKKFEQQLHENKEN